VPDRPTLAVLAALRDDPSPSVRAAAAFVLARRRERRAIPLVEAELARGAVDLLQEESLKLALLRLNGTPASQAK